MSSTTPTHPPTHPRIVNPPAPPPPPTQPPPLEGNPWSFRPTKPRLNGLARHPSQDLQGQLPRLRGQRGEENLGRERADPMIRPGTAPSAGRRKGVTQLLANLRKKEINKTCQGLESGVRKGLRFSHGYRETERKPLGPVTQRVPFDHRIPGTSRLYTGHIAVCVQIDVYTYVYLFIQTYIHRSTFVCVRVGTLSPSTSILGN